MRSMAAAFLSHTRPEDTEMAVDGFKDELIESIRAIRAAKAGEALTGPAAGPQIGANRRP